MFWTGLCCCVEECGDDSGGGSRVSCCKIRKKFGMKAVCVWCWR